MFNNPFLKNDSLLEAVKQAQQDGNVRRAAEAQVNEEFGVYSRKAVIRENLAAYDARLAELVEAKLADKDYDKDGKVESPKAEVLGSRIRAAKAAGKLEEGPVDAGSMEGSKSVTKSAPKEDPSLPKSYPGAASSAPTAQRLSNAKAAVTPIKEDEQIDELYGKGSLGKIKGHHEKESNKYLKKSMKIDDARDDDGYDEASTEKRQRRYARSDAAEKKHEYHRSQSKRASGLMNKLNPKSDKGDKLAARSGPANRAAVSGPRKGKILAGQRDQVKANIKWSLGKHKKPNLPEGYELDEAAYSAKAGRAGKDLGKPGKQFAKIAAKAGEKYGSEEKGKKVAGAILAKIRAKHMKEENIQELSAFGKAFAAAKGQNFSFGGKQYSGARADQKTSSAPLPPTKPAELKAPTTWKDPVSAGYDKPAASSTPETKPTSLPTMAQSNVGPKTGAGTGVDTSAKTPAGDKVNYSAPDVKAGQDKMKAMASLKESVQVGANKYKIV